MVGVGRELVGNWSELQQSWSGLVGSWSELVGVAPSCGFSDHWGCLGRLGNMLALLWVVLTTVAHISLHFGVLGDTLGLFRLILVVWGTLWGTFGHPGCHFEPHFGALGVLLGVIWHLLGPLWAPLGRPGAARGAKVEKKSGGPEVLTTFWN